MTTPHYELFEGNQCFNFDGESTWGNSIYNTILRNNLTGKRRDAGKVGLTEEGYRRAASLSWGHYWYSFVGNVLGYEGMSPAPFAKAFSYETLYSWDDDPIGLWNVGVGEDWGPADPQVAATLIRHGNFDYATSSVKWDSAITDHTIPNSLYLTKKPVFFGNCPWPWVTPEGSNKTAYLPAKVRFDTTLFDSACPPCLASRIISDKGLSPSSSMRNLEIVPLHFKRELRIGYTVSCAGYVKIEILNMLGQTCGYPVDGYQSAGHHFIYWDASRVGAGIFLCRLRAGSQAQTSKVFVR